MKPDMVASKSPRNAAWEGLKRLSLDRVDVSAPINEIFHWGLFPKPGQARDRKEERALALVSTAVVEQGLEYALTTKFSRAASEIRDQMFDGEGAVLRDLNAKIRLAYIMSIIGKETRSDLSAIRRIRNTFAHSRLRIDFDTPEIAAACAQITLPDRWEKMMSDEERPRPREAFLQTCFQYALWLFTVDADLGEDEAKVDNFQRRLLRS